MEQHQNLRSYGVSYRPDPSKFHVWYFWQGPTMPNVYLKTVRLNIYTHPNAQIFIASNELSDSLLDSYNKEGYEARVVRFDLDKLTEAEAPNASQITGGPGREFVDMYKAVKAGNSTLKATAVHLSDFMRLLLLYKFGGFYVDTDGFVLRNMESVRNALGAEPSTAVSCMDSKRHFTRNGVPNISCICNCVLAFDKGHPFLADALTTYIV
jgi:hypothetical protein